MDEKNDLSSDDENELTAPDSKDDSNDSLLTVSFNQDGGCLAVGTARGFRICNVSPYQETFRRTFSTGDGGGIGSVEMLFRCNLLALVGGGASPQYPPNKVLIWDDHLGRPIGELSFRQKVLTVKLRRDRICVALRDRVYVYNFGNLALLDTIITGGEKNGLGLLSISTDAGGKSGSLSGESDDDGMVLACPSVQRGQVRIELYGMRKNLLIDAHESPLAALALSVDGSLLATASERGTIIRLFETGKKVKGPFGSNTCSSSHPPGTPIREFRRGVEHAVIGCLSFSIDKMWLACASDHETVHIFKIYEEDSQNLQSGNSSRPAKSPAKSKSSLSYASMYAKKILPNMLTKSPKTYLQGEQSFAQVRGGITRPQICAFVPDKPYTIAVVGLDNYGNGCLMLSSFGSNHDNSEDGPYAKETSHAVKGQAKRLSFHRFFKKGMDKKNRLRHTSNNDVFTGDCQVVCSDDAELDIPMDETNPDFLSSKSTNEEHDFVSVAAITRETSTPTAIHEESMEAKDDTRALECDEKCVE